MRGLWFLAGTAAGVYATSKARKAAEAVTLDGIHDRLTGLFAGARVLREEYQTGRAEKEAELRHRVAVDAERRQLAGQVTSLESGRAARQAAEALELAD